MKVSIVHERGDDLVATAARASFNRSYDHYTEEDNVKLINYLANAKPEHWAPFGHIRLTLQMKHWMIIYKKLTANNKAGLVEVRNGDSIDVSHSFYGWVKLLQERKIHFNAANSVIDHLQAIAPDCAQAFNIESLRPSQPIKDEQQLELAERHYATDFVTLRITCPIVMARQLFKHQVGFIYSEASGRYIEYTKQYLPTSWHVKPDNKKQGAGQELGIIRKSIAILLTKLSHAVSYATYIIMHRLLNIAIEEARYCMAMSTSTTFVVTASRKDWDRVIEHRTPTSAQTDIRVLSGLIEEQLNA